MNLQTLNFVVVLTFLICVNEIDGVPLPYPQYTYQQGYRTGMSGGVHHHDPYHDECYESSLHGGLAAHPQIGTDVKLAGIHSGGLRCKQGIS